MPRLYQFIVQTCSNRMFYQPFSCFSSSQLLPFHSHPNSSPFSLLRKRKQTLEKHGVLIVLAICTWKWGLLWNVVDMSSVTPLGELIFPLPAAMICNQLLCQVWGFVTMSPSLGLAFDWLELVQGRQVQAITVSVRPCAHLCCDFWKTSFENHPPPLVPTSFLPWPLVYIDPRALRGGYDKDMLKISHPGLSTLKSLLSAHYLVVDHFASYCPLEEEASLLKDEQCSSLCIW